MSVWYEERREEVRAALGCGPGRLCMGGVREGNDIGAVGVCAERQAGTCESQRVFGANVC